MNIIAKSYDQLELKFHDILKSNYFLNKDITKFIDNFLVSNKNINNSDTNHKIVRHATLRDQPVAAPTMRVCTGENYFWCLFLKLLLLQSIQKAVEARGLGATKVQKVKAHSTEKDVEEEKQDVCYHGNWKTYRVGRM